MKTPHEAAHQKTSGIGSLTYGMSTGLNILIFDQALTEPLDCYEIMKKSPLPSNFRASSMQSCKCLNDITGSALVSIITLGSTSFGPVSLFLSYWTIQILPLDGLLWPVSSHSHPLLTHFFMGTRMSWLHLKTLSWCYMFVQSGWLVSYGHTIQQLETSVYT